MPSIPSVDELKKMFNSESYDSAVKALSRWKEPNFDESCDEEAYLERAERNVTLLADKINDVLDTI